MNCGIIASKFYQSQNYLNVSINPSAIYKFCSEITLSPPFIHKDWLQNNRTFRLLKGSIERESNSMLSRFGDGKAGL